MISLYIVIIYYLLYLGLLIVFLYIQGILILVIYLIGNTKVIKVNSFLVKLTYTSIV